MTQTRGRALLGVCTLESGTSSSSTGSSAQESTLQELWSCSVLRDVAQNERIVPMKLGSKYIFHFIFVINPCVVVFIEVVAEEARRGCPAANSYSSPPAPLAGSWWESIRRQVRNTQDTGRIPADIWARHRILAIQGQFQDTSRHCRRMHSFKVILQEVCVCVCVCVYVYIYIYRRFGVIYI